MQTKIKPLPLWKKLLREKELAENREIKPATMAIELGLSTSYLHLILNTITGYQKRLVDIGLYLGITPEKLRESRIRELAIMKDYGQNGL